jgi:DNA repair protein SbcD/Mre11
MRFLHLADLHLDSPFAGRTARLRTRLREAARQALSTAVSVALEEELDALLIAGDLLDGEDLSFATERHLMAELGRLEEGGVQVVYVTGNHDPGMRGGAVSRVPWPEGIRVIDGPEPVAVEIRRDGETVGVVTGAGHPSNRFGEDLSRAFPRPRGPLPQVGLLHTQVGGATGEGEHHRYAPSELARLERSGHHYWALGHIHLRQELSAIPSIHYPGNLQGRSPRETGAKGGLLVDLSTPGAPGVEFVELAPTRWERLRVQGLESLQRIEEVVRRVEEAWREVRDEDPGRPGTDWLVRVELAGPSPIVRDLESEEERAGMAEALAGTLGLMDVEIRTDALRPFRRVEPHLDRQDVVGEALRLIRELVRDPDRSPAAELEVEAGDLAGYEPGTDAALDEYLRGLLEGEEATLVDALLEDPE